MATKRMVDKALDCGWESRRMQLFKVQAPLMLMELTAYCRFAVQLFDLLVFELNLQYY
jgi:hypothetical protein